MNFIQALKQIVASNLIALKYQFFFTYPPNSYEKQTHQYIKQK